MNERQSRTALRLMLNSRFFEEKTESMFQQGLIHGTTHLANGQEACQAGLCMALKDGDWIVPTHRCHGFTLCYGSNPYEMFSEMLGSRYGLAKGLGGSMHMPDAECCNAGSSAVVGSGIPLAAGLAFSLKARDTGSTDFASTVTSRLKDKPKQKAENIAVAIFGDGACSRGSLHETLDIAAIWRLPLLFFCENNLYGMSASSDDMISAPSIADRAAGYNIPHVTVDGNDVQAVFDAVRKARRHIASGNGPFFIEAKTYRFKGHSKSDKRVYRTREEEEFWLAKDPIVLLERRLRLTPDQIKRLEKNLSISMDIMADYALKTKDDKLSQEEMLSLVTAPSNASKTTAQKRTLSYRDAIRQALDDEMSNDKSVFLMGEDVGRYGGCFKVTQGLCDKHPAQVIDTPVAEEGFTGLAVGAAMNGMRPVIEVMYADFFTLVADGLINHAAKTYFMSGGQFKCPLVARFPMGSGTGHGSQHTQSPESAFMNIPGLKIIAPSNASDAYHLLRQAIRDDNPVLVFEHKTLYSTECEISETGPLIGEANIIRKGKDITIVSYSRAVQTALETAKLLEKENINAEVIDLCTLKPLDMDTIAASIQKTGRLAVIEDTPMSGSIGSEVISQASQLCFANLKASPKLISGLESPIPFSKELEAASIPNAQDCAKAIFKLII